MLILVHFCTCWCHFAPHVTSRTHEICGFGLRNSRIQRIYTLHTLSRRDGAKKRPKTSKNDPKGPQRAPQGFHFGPFWLLWGPFWTTFGSSGLILGLILRLYGVPDGPNGPQSAPKRPMWVHLGPCWSLLKPIWVHFGPFWPLFHVLGGHFFTTCPHILEEPFCTSCLVFHRCTALHYLFCFSQMCSSAPSALRGPGLPLQVPRSAFASLKATRSLDISYVLCCERSEQQHPRARDGQNTLLVLSGRTTGRSFGPDL